MRIVIEAQYFPPVAYFWLLNQSSEALLDLHEYFVKQTYRNRMVINGANGPLSLTIPIQHEQPKMAMKEVKVDHQAHWRKQHWRSIRSAYGKAPFFDHFAPYVEPLYQKQHEHLIDYLQETLTICQRLMSTSFTVAFSESYIEGHGKADYDFRSAISPKTDTRNLAGFSPKPYFQLFGKDFVPNISVLDLLFCEGPNALSIIDGSGEIKKEQLEKTGRFVL